MFSSGGILHLLASLTIVNSPCSTFLIYKKRIAELIFQILQVFVGSADCSLSSIRSWQPLGAIHFTVADRFTSRSVITFSLFKAHVRMWTRLDVTRTTKKTRSVQMMDFTEIYLKCWPSVFPPLADSTPAYSCERHTLHPDAFSMQIKLNFCILFIVIPNTHAHRHTMCVCVCMLYGGTGGKRSYTRRSAR